MTYPSNKVAFLTGVTLSGEDATLKKHETLVFTDRLLETWIYSNNDIS